METIKVRINYDGITAIEVNPRIKPSEFHTLNQISDHEYISSIGCQARLWQEAEGKLRTFKIDFSHLNELFEAIELKLGGIISHSNIGYDPGTIRNAEILDNDKLIIRIV